MAVPLTVHESIHYPRRKCSPTTKTRNSCNCLYIFQNCSLSVYISRRGVLASNSPPCNICSLALSTTRHPTTRGAPDLSGTTGPLCSCCSLTAQIHLAACLHGRGVARAAPTLAAALAGLPPQHLRAPRTARRPSVAHRENLCELSPWPCSGAPVSIRAPVSCMLHIVFPKEGNAVVAVLRRRRQRFSRGRPPCRS